MDAIFGAGKFRSEIVWRPSNAHNKLSKQYGPIHDTILVFTKGDGFHFVPGKTPYMAQYLAKEFRDEDSRGRFRVNEIMGPGRRTGESGQLWRGYEVAPVL
jgi:site-specific DNA-methyltransferase (adenine-specific)